MSIAVLNSAKSLLSVLTRDSINGMNLSSEFTFWSGLRINSCPQWKILSQSSAEQLFAHPFLIPILTFILDLAPV